jgi:hypothetical protein
MVINSKKGNAITNPMIVLSIILLFGVLSFGFFNFSLDLVNNSNNKLTNESIIYIAENNGFELENTNLSGQPLSIQELESSFYVQDENSTTSEKDYALEFLYYRGESVSWRALINSVYNLPAYTIRSLGLDLSEWVYVINGLNVFIWAIIFFVIYKIVRGIIR